MSKKTLIIIIVISVLICGGILYALLRGKNDNSYSFKTARIDRGDIQITVTATGTLEPVNVVEVGSQVSGRIAKLYADFNSFVKKGQVIAELEQSLFITRVHQSEANYKSAKAEVEKAKVRLNNAKKALDRAISLYEKSLISKEEKEKAEETYYSSLADLQSAEARLEQAKAQLESAKVDLEHTIITSPIDGLVISRNVNVGQTVAASFQAPVLFKIAEDLTRMYLTCHVDEADIGKVEPGQRVVFTVDAFPEEKFEGKVIQVRYNPQTIQNVVTYDTIVEVRNDKLKLRPGMTATASIITAEKNNVLRVPNSALKFTPPPDVIKKLRKNFQSLEKRKPGSGQRAQQFARTQRPKNFSIIWAVDENKNLKPIPIITGLADDSYTEIIRILRGELKEGQEVAIGFTKSSSTGRRRTSPVRGFRMIVR